MSEEGAILGEMGEAVRRPIEHVEGSHGVDRGGWTEQQWIDDAMSIFDDPAGSDRDLLNGHVIAMLSQLRRVNGGTEIWWCALRTSPHVCNAERRGLGHVGCGRRLLVEV